MTGYAFCTPVANTAPAARGSKNFEKAILYMANGAKSHPCSSAPRWYILVPALPGFAKILRAPNSLHKCICLQANRRQYLVKHWEDRLIIIKHFAAAITTSARENKHAI
ncbi:hypothetical protein DWV68_08735 [Roseburia sp. AF12-17LB]|nr:hypothetical protein DWX65_08610 [Roseburia sp. AF20-18LB]RHS24184.1 hypothetical protein DWV68_08735 [Roseburia sp. AF12-17LB]